jgi:A/G-specific adenine glycosylase
VTAVVEILLKQTRASSVEDEARMFVERYPNPQSLASASTRRLIRDLKPFGFHRQRAVHLKALGVALAKEGRVISADRDNLLSLPGIGPYAASAIRCFVYGASEPVIDVNIVRIVERVFGVTYQRGEGRRNKDVKRLAAALLNGRQPREVNWALLDLGALVCRERRPLCNDCPLNQVCLTPTKAVAA